ncbi:MAG: DNA-binding protein [Deltaproteobacteria bacterium]|nr:DNA-binding protein [Candidatus Anaeroferrophillacea bacterium]
MADLRPMEPVQTWLGRLAHGADLLGEIADFCRERHIVLGRVEGIGAVQRARLGYYDQAAREYRFFDLDRPLEITCLLGNISLRDGEPMVHAHLTLADADGRAYGGHLAPGTVIFATELLVTSFSGPGLHRAFDEPTGLPLWRLG